MRYQAEGVPLVVIAGQEYGTGSSRDWAAKGTTLLGVKAVIAESFERIHRSNLIGMGVLPLQFVDGQNRRSLSLTGHEILNDSRPVGAPSAPPEAAGGDSAHRRTPGQLRGAVPHRHRQRSATSSWPAAFFTTCCARC